MMTLEERVQMALDKLDKMSKEDFIEWVTRVSGLTLEQYAELVGMEPEDINNEQKQ